MQNIGVIDNLQPKLLPFYRDELLHSRPTDCHQLKAIPSHIPIIMTSITWAGPRCVQELATILASQNRVQGRCVLFPYLQGAAWLSGGSGSVAGGRGLGLVGEDGGGG